MAKVLLSGAQKKNYIALRQINISHHLQFGDNWPFSDVSTQN